MFYRTFNPGPSQVTDATKEDVREALDNNIIGISHRSTAFKAIAEQAVTGLRTYFAVPDDYHVLFCSSATEAMELVVRNLVEKESFHFTNGHFSELFARISESFGKSAPADKVAWGLQNDVRAAEIPEAAEIVTLTYNETSTGTMASEEMVRNLRKRVDDDALLVIDVTSAAGCVPFAISDADVWLFSVQKGLGLPAGLGVLFISPAAFERSNRQKQAGLFHFNRMIDHIATYQTIQTPNVLGIYLLAKQLERWNRTPGANYADTEVKARLLNKFIDHHEALGYFVKDPAARSTTTICIEADSNIINAMHKAAEAEDIVLGAGYGRLKGHTCRIANFPALDRADMQQLIKVLSPAITE